MNFTIVDGIAQPGSPAVAPSLKASSFGEALAQALEGTSDALRGADAQAALIAAGGDDVAGASIARAKADVALEVISVAASRVSGAVNSLLQTQV
ncbi:MAG TPA: flagellar hook-basal body complex protein FliE [Candidatus Eremiobacteraceae bacterium]|nr:flagellar hook-basal body complex protein FliE [Candidatus Eremiobacteraceae bacterium]